MKTTKIFLLLGLAGLLVSTAWAEYQYYPSTVETITGDVIDDQTGSIFHFLGLAKDMKIVVKTNKETLEVLLGPKSFLDTQNLKVVKSDRIKVTGSRVILDDAPTIIAAEITRGDQVLKLRDKEGAPLWAGGNK
jgi:hypothetical protein